MKLFFLIISGRPQKSAGFIRSAGFYVQKIKYRLIKSAGPFHGIYHRVNALLAMLLAQFLMILNKDIEKKS
jgi:hypothetical protein